jgi:hypothetical protein
LARAPDDPVADVREEPRNDDTTLPGGDAAGLTVTARNRPDLLPERLRPWLPFLLRHAGLEEALAEPLLTFIVARLPQMGEGRFRHLLPAWLEEFARQQGRGGQLRPLHFDNEFHKAARAEALARVLPRVAAQAAQGETAWEKRLRQRAADPALRLDDAGGLLRLADDPSPAQRERQEQFLEKLARQAERACEAELRLVEFV